MATIPRQSLKMRIRAPSTLKCKLLITVVLVSLLIVLCIAYNSRNLTNHHLSFENLVGMRLNYCKIPHLDPSNYSVMKTTETSKLTEKDFCHKYPLLFNATSDSVIPSGPEIANQWGVTECCYYAIERGIGDGEEADNAYRNALNGASEKISLTNSTKIPQHHELIAVYCKFEGNQTSLPKGIPVLVDVFYFAHLKPEVEKRLKEKENETEGKLNVIVFGIDSLSRMNFIRMLPKSYKFLMEELDAVEMRAYSTVGWITFSNLGPLLTSLSHEELTASCAKDGYFDTCPGIWKHFSNAGYRTSYIEDWPSAAILNYFGNGFRNAPTDYYPRPLALKAEREFQDVTCQGPRLSITKLIDYMKAFVDTMKRENKPFFHLSWSTSQTHEPKTINDAHIVDAPLLQGLEWLKEMNYLNNTILIVMSDHGIRNGPFGNEELGLKEFQLPFMFFVVPPYFKQNYPLAFKNLQGNANRLTSNFDLYETLKDIAKINGIREDPLLQRIKILRHQEKWSMLPRGISHFVPIPLSRTCADAGIKDVYCACENLWRIVDRQDPLIKEGVRFALNQSNAEVLEHPKCRKLVLKRINLAKEVVQEHDNNYPEKIFTAAFASHGVIGETTIMLSVGKSNNWGVLDRVVPNKINWFRVSCVNDTKVQEVCACPSRIR